MVSEQRPPAMELRINTGWGIDPQQASVGAKARLFVGTESDVRNENCVLRKLHQAPRYFRPPECSSNFGEYNLEPKRRKAKRKEKLCYICACIGHKGKRCKQVKRCSICSKKGHPHIYCPSRDVKADSTPSLCLLCGGTGHDMFSCTASYDSEDLKDIGCYICRKVGHLCCVDSKSEEPREASCYKCGESGHVGSECTKLIMICPKCGESGHDQQQCTKVAAIASARTERTKAQRARKRMKARLMATVDARQNKPKRVCRPQIVGPCRPVL